MSRQIPLLQVLCAVAMLVLTFGRPFDAAAFSGPSGQVVLSVAGAIAGADEGVKADFDIAMLEGMPTTEVVTATPWYEGVQRFEGVLVRDLLARVGATGTTLQATALNNYRIEIPITDFRRYPVLLAFKRNGKYMSVRDKGPLWIIYPLDAHPELKATTTYDKMIWQLRTIVVR